MSSVSVTSSRKEKVTADLMQELESLRALNSSLRTYLEHVRVFKQNILAMDKNFDQLNKVNSQWVELLSRK